MLGSLLERSLRSDGILTVESTVLDGGLDGRLLPFHGLFIEVASEGFDGGVAEEVGGGDVDLGALLQHALDAEEHEGVAAVLEEVRVGVDSVEIEELLPDTGDHAFGLAEGWGGDCGGG